MLLVGEAGFPANETKKKKKENLDSTCLHVDSRLIRDGGMEPWMMEMMEPRNHENKKKEDDEKQLHMLALLAWC